MLSRPAFSSSLRARSTSLLIIFPSSSLRAPGIRRRRRRCRHLGARHGAGPPHRPRLRCLLRARHRGARARRRQHHLALRPCRGLPLGRRAQLVPAQRLDAQGRRRRRSRGPAGLRRPQGAAVRLVGGQAEADALGPRRRDLRPDVDPGQDPRGAGRGRHLEGAHARRGGVCREVCEAQPGRGGLRAADRALLLGRLRRRPLQALDEGGVWQGLRPGAQGRVDRRRRPGPPEGEEGQPAAAARRAPPPQARGADRGVFPQGTGHAPERDRRQARRRPRRAQLAAQVDLERGRRQVLPPVRHSPGTQDRESQVRRADRPRLRRRRPRRGQGARRREIPARV